MLLYFAYTALSIFYTSDTDQYLTEVRVKLPFLMIPIGMSLPVIQPHKRRSILYIFITAVLFTGIVSLLNYFLHFSEYNELLTHSKPIPIAWELNHIYFGVLISLAANILAFDLLNAAGKGWNYKAGLELTAFLVLLIVLHTITARTGLLCFYGGLTAVVAWFIIKQKKILAGIIISLAAVALLYGSLHYMPSLKNRISNTREDLSTYYNHQDVNNYSMAKRFVALKTAMHIFYRHPVFGVAPADIGQEMQEQNIHEKNGLEGDNLRMEPHNQFVETLVTMGIIGFALLILIFLYPVFTLKQEHFYLILLLVCYFLASQVEDVLERQVGITAFALFYILFSRIPTNAIRSYSRSISE